MTTATPPGGARAQRVRVRLGPGDHCTTLADGRAITWREVGDPAGTPVVALHGTPGSRFKYEAAHTSAIASGLRLVCPDRWAYGGSDAPARPSLPAYAADVAELCDRLGIGCFALVGVSGGGPFATAAASVLAGRITRLALVSPVGPITTQRDLRLFHRFCFGLLPHVPGALHATFEAYRIALRIAPGPATRLAAAFAKGADKHLLRDEEVRAGLARTFAAGFEGGARGGVLDIRLFAQPWGIDPGAVSAQTRLWLGADDKNVPHAPVRDLAERLPGATLTMLEGEGHFWIARRHGDVLKWLAGETVGAAGA